MSGSTVIVQCERTKKPIGPARPELLGSLIASKADSTILAVIAA
jgi:hypothetical protein